jgi:prepilin-type N-terminal cleavage/methylation domain-containing protein
MAHRCTPLRRGFTLVELLIVVIILAILAAIVIPQFAASTDDAKLAAADTTLSNVRSAIDLYFQQHGEYPSANAAGAGFGAAGTASAFVDQLALYTDDDGAASLTRSTTFKYGPYVRSRAIPREPLTDSSALKIETAGTLGLAAEGSDPGGWRFDNLTGQFIINHSSYDDR